MLYRWKDGEEEPYQNIPKRHKKQKKRHKCRITPLAQKCSKKGCGKKVKFHHWLCEYHANQRDKIHQQKNKIGQQ